MPMIQAVERALGILDLFDEFSTELKHTEICKRMQLNKSTTHSLLKTLQKHGYLDQNSDSGKYRLGLKLFERGNAAICHLDIRTVARKYLLDLSRKTGHTLHLVVLDGKEGVYIDKIEGTTANVLYSGIGRRAPFHSTGVGKALVAFKTDQELEKMLDGYVFEIRTPNTIMSKQDFLEEAGKIRARGYAFDREENEPGISCIAVPIRDHSGAVIAAFSISLPTPQLNDEQEHRLVPIMEQAGKKISEELGYESVTYGKV